jgi:predicted nucleotidyltransferase
MLLRMQAPFAPILSAGLQADPAKSNVFRVVAPLICWIDMEIIDLLKSHANDIKTRFCVRRIGIFGSFARGEQKESSDIDILVEFEKPTFRNFMNLSFYLENLLGRKVDLVTVKGLHPRIRPYVEKDVIWSE